jgi:hypothetical protein
MFDDNPQVSRRTIIIGIIGLLLCMQCLLVSLLYPDVAVRRCPAHAREHLPFPAASPSVRPAAMAARSTCFCLAVTAAFAT